MIVRRQRDDNYRIVAEIWNACYPLDPVHADEIRSDDAMPGDDVTLGLSNCEASTCWQLEVARIRDLSYGDVG